MKDESFRPNRVLSYFQEEWKILFFVTVSGRISVECEDDRFIFCTISEQVRDFA